MAPVWATLQKNLTNIKFLQKQPSNPWLKLGVIKCRKKLVQDFIDYFSRGAKRRWSLCDITTSERQICWFFLPQSQPSLDIKYERRQKCVETEQWPPRSQSLQTCPFHWYIYQNQKNQLFVSLLNGLRTLSEKALNLTLDFEMDSLLSLFCSHHFGLSGFTIIPYVIIASSYVIRRHRPTFLSRTLKFL